MTDRLTDEQVTALPGELLHAATWLETIEDRAAYEAGWSAVKRAMQLVPEVQRARARRCDRCACWHGGYSPDGSMGVCTTKALNGPGGGEPVTRPDFFCADFTPRSQPPETTP